MAATLTTCFILLLSIGCIRALSAPLYCSYDESENHYTCDYSKMSDPANRPIDFSQFDPEPQRMTINVNGYLPYYGDNRTFSEEFANISVADFDSNYPASLVVDCGWYGSLYFADGAFANMSHVQHLTIRNCYTFYIPAEAFKDLVNLDYLAFEGGAIDLVDADAMASLTVEKLHSDTHTFPQTLGHFETRNCLFNVKYVPPGLLFNWKNLTSVTLRNSDLNTVSADTFRYTPKLRYIDLSDNLFTNIPTGLFDGLDSLAEVHFHNIDWFCSCENLWWYTHLKDRNVTIFGELMCDTPSGISVGRFWYGECVKEDICGDQIGMVWKDQKLCLSIFDFLRYGFSIISFGVMIPSLALIIHAKRQMPAGGGRPSPGSRLNKAMNSSMAMSKMKMLRKPSSDDVMEFDEKGTADDDRDRERRRDKKKHRDGDRDDDDRRDDRERKRERKRDRRREKEGERRKEKDDLRRQDYHRGIEEYDC